MPRDAAINKSLSQVHPTAVQAIPPAPSRGRCARRLTDIRANAKFSSPYATAEDISSVRVAPPLCWEGREVSA